MRIPPIYGENYDAHWGGVFDFKGKVVLDVGADIGSTADWFLNKGARQVVAVESAPAYYKQLEENAKKILEIVPVHLKISKSWHFICLLLSWKFDVAKIDCEWCEKHLIDVSCDLLRSVPQWMIETHHKNPNDTHTHDAIYAKFRNCGFAAVKDFKYDGNLWVTFFQRKE